MKLETVEARLEANEDTGDSDAIDEEIEAIEVGGTVWLADPEEAVMLEMAEVRLWAGTELGCDTIDEKDGMLDSIDDAVIIWLKDCGMEEAKKLDTAERRLCEVEEIILDSDVTCAD
jgi:hypothetical protein